MQCNLFLLFLIVVILLWNGTFRALSHSLPSFSAVCVCLGSSVCIVCCIHTHPGASAECSRNYFLKFFFKWEMKVPKDLGTDTRTWATFAIRLKQTNSWWEVHFWGGVITFYEVAMFEAISHIILYVHLATEMCSLDNECLVCVKSFLCYVFLFFWVGGTTHQEQSCSIEKCFWLLDGR